MFKNNLEKEMETVLPTGSSTVEPKFTRYMVGTYLDPVTREWYLSYVKFDPSTKQVAEIKVERVAGDYEVMRERLLIAQAKLGLFGVDDVQGEGELEKIY